MKSAGLITAVWIFFVTGPAQAEVLKVGVVVPLSGTAASAGLTVRNSIELASKEFDPNVEVEFLFEDDQLLPKNTVIAVQKLVSSDKVRALIVYGTPTSLSVNSFAEQKRIPMIALSVLNRVVEGKSCVMKHWVTAERETERLGQEFKKRRYQRVAIVTAMNEAMLRLRDLFLPLGADAVIFNQEFERENTDFRAAAAKIKLIGADAVYNLLWPPQPGLFAKALREAGFSGAIFGAHNLEDPGEIAASRGALEGSWIVTADDSRAGAYYRAYQENFGSQPAAGGTNAYDVAKMMIEGAKSADLNAYLHSLKGFHGSLGEYSATENNDFDIPAAIKVNRSGRYEIDAK